MLRLKFVGLSLLPLALFFLLSFGAPHTFYVSVTRVVYVEEEDAFQITSRVFIDDLEGVLLERYGIETSLATPRESPLADEYIERYFRSKFAVELDGEAVEYNFLGKRYDLDVVLCYLEIPQVGLSKVEQMSVRNELLTDRFDDQKNVVHIQWKGHKKSFVLVKEDNMGMLNL